MIEASSSGGLTGDLIGDLFTGADRERLAERGLDEAEARRQLGLLRHPPAPIELDRPATPGDGVLRLDAERRAACRELYDAAAAAGRFSKLVPASGAASRMFKALVAMRRGTASSDDLAVGQRFLDHLDRFAFSAQLSEAMAARRRSDSGAVDALAALLDADGLAFAERPKGLIPFHRYPEAPRTPFAEHLVEGAAHLTDAAGRCRLHFTVLAEHAPRFEAELEAIRPRLEAALGVRFEVGFSTQDPATDTVAVEADGRLWRDEAGRIAFRPGGHGALLRNLGRLAGEGGGDLVVLKNIDNVLPADRQGEVVEWKRILGGLLVGLERRIEELLEAAQRGAAGFVEAAHGFVSEELGLDAAPERAALIARLDRPLRVCGVVENRGEPGGGPFWVRGLDGEVTPQIVEMAQIDRDRPDQAEIVARATHFNPVDLVCRLRDHRGRPFALERYVDPEAVIVSTRSQAGRPLRVLEHPGLWNGAMARWNTVFVEVPASTFAPVKTVLDLLRPEHQS